LSESKFVGGASALLCNKWFEEVLYSIYNIDTNKLRSHSLHLMIVEIRR